MVSYCGWWLSPNRIATPHWICPFQRIKPSKLAMVPPFRVCCGYHHPSIPRLLRKRSLCCFMSMAVHETHRQKSWRMDSQLWHPYLTQQGIAVFQCDNRSSRGNGSRDTWGVHREFGKIELQDLEDAVRWLHQQPWVDRERIAIWGWSYGGYFTSYALTHTDLFCAGIAGARSPTGAITIPFTPNDTWDCLNRI